MVRTAALVLAPILLAGCNLFSPEARLTPPQKQCWAVAKELARSPSTAKLVSATGADDFAFIEFDAANAYGTPVRTKIGCTLAKTTDPDGFRVTAANINGEEVEALSLTLANVSLIGKAK